jgi:hypothetical protein
LLLAVRRRPERVERVTPGLRRARQLDAGSKPAELAALVIRVYRSLDALVGNNEVPPPTSRAPSRRNWRTGAGASCSILTGWCTSTW